MRYRVTVTGTGATRSNLGRAEALQWLALHDGPNSPVTVQEDRPDGRTLTPAELYKRRGA